jgi:hypothetical protein
VIVIVPRGTTSSPVSLFSNLVLFPLGHLHHFPFLDVTAMM